MRTVRPAAPSCLSLQFRFDRAVIAPDWVETPEGFLRIRATFARTGCQTYRNDDGTQRVEYRSEAEVARKDALLSLGGLPVTLEHPPTLLNPDNARQYQRGSSGTVVNYDNGFVTGTVTLTDREAIDAVRRGDARELSVGYRCDYDATPGVAPDGTRFDGQQRAVSGNHHALTRKARGGSEIRLHFDSADGEELPGAAIWTAVDPLSPPTTEETPMATARADAKKAPTKPAMSEEELEDPEEEGMETNEEELAEEAGTAESMAKKKDGMKKDAGCDKEKMDSELVDLLDGQEDAVPFAAFEKVLQQRNDALAELEQANGRLDALDDQLTALEANIDARLDAADKAFDERLNQRIALLSKAEVLIGERQTFDGFSDREVMVEALTKAGVDVSAFEARSDDYIAARFDQSVENELGAVKPEDLEALLSRQPAARSDGADVVAEAQARKMRRDADAHKASN